MSDPGLTHRLSQRSRRAGLMIGISMVMTIAFCAVAFTLIYTALEGFTTDFVSGTDETAPAVQQVADEPTPPATDAAPAAGDTSQQANQDAPNDQDSIPTPTPTSDNESGNQDEDDGFSPDYQTTGTARINLREGPSTATSIVDTLDESTPLEYLDEDASTDGTRWMRFRTEDGLEGWMREVDVTEFES